MNFFGWKKRDQFLNEQKLSGVDHFCKSVTLDDLTQLPHAIEAVI